MRAIVITESGGPEVLAVREVPTPEPGPGQIRVRVTASALNRADVLQRMGAYPAPPDAPSDIPGLEFAGAVDAVGTGASAWQTGDRVFGIVGGGAHAEFVVTHERAVARIPERLDDVTAAAVPEAYITAHDALVTRGRVRSGSRVLVHAVGSGVGLATVQICAAIHAPCWGTARTADKLARATEHGLRHAIDPTGFAERILADTGGAGIDAIVDFVGADHLDEHLRVLAPRGRLVLVGLLSGARAEIDLGLVLRKRLEIIGTVLRSRPIEEKIDATQRFAREIVPLLANGALQPVVDSVVPFARIADAHTRMSANENFGKIVLRW